MNLRNLFLLFIFAMLGSCTPKAGQSTTETKPTTPTPTTGTKKECATFNDTKNPDQALENFVLYRDFLKANDWDLAYDYWKKVYNEAPAADGKRSTVFTDGMRFYEHFIEQDSTKKEEYITEIFKLYDEMAKCYSEGGHTTGLMAFDYYYKYPDRISQEDLYKLFKQSIAENNGKPAFFIINPFTALLVDLTVAEKIPVAESQKYQKAIRDAIAKGLKECEGKDCDNWKIIAEYAPLRMEGMEAIEDYYDCAYYSEKYYPAFQAAPTDCDVITTTYSRLKWGKCPDTNPRMKEVYDAYMKSCYEAPTSPVAECNTFLQNGKYRDAINCYEDLLSKMSDNKEKASVKLLIAKIYYAYLKNYSRARQYALEAAQLRSGWGAPYILIGTLYASSGPLCGPGRGWDSQVVAWPAIDMWNKAKSIDPSVASEANKLIGTYVQYMPSVEEIFQRGLKEGGSYFVPCWIQQSTTIRGAK